MATGSLCHVGANMSEDIDELLEDAEELEITEEGEIVRKGSPKRSPGRGVRLKEHTFYAGYNR